MKKTLLAAASLAAALMLSTAASAAPTTFRLCTGGEAGNYFKAGHVLKSKLGSVNVEVIPTQGSLDNLARLTKGDCDGAFVQSDAMMVFSSKNAAAISGIERAGVLYQEHAHLLCNKSAGVSRVTDLSAKHTIAVGPEGSGARTTWDAFVMADKKRYAPVQIDGRAGPRALAAIEDGTTAQCALFVAAPYASFISNDAQKYGDRIALIPTDDWDMGKVAKDARGKPVYGYSEIASDTYKRLQPAGTVYGTKAVKTITVDALFVTSINWANANDKPYEAVLRGFSDAKPSIMKLVEPKN